MDGQKLTDFEKALLDQQVLDIETVMGSKNGRSFMWRILEFCGIYRDIEGEDAAMLKQIGNRQTGLYILGILSDANDELVFKMMREAKETKQTEEIYYDNRDNDDSASDDNPFGIPSASGDPFS